MTDANTLLRQLREAERIMHWVLLNAPMDDTRWERALSRATQRYYRRQTALVLWMKQDKVTHD